MQEIRNMEPVRNITDLRYALYSQAVIPGPLRCAAYVRDLYFCSIMKNHIISEQEHCLSQLLTLSCRDPFL